jgi:O-antigen/teichoic acid export membrane protein
MSFGLAASFAFRYLTKISWVAVLSLLPLAKQGGVIFLQTIMIASQPLLSIATLRYYGATLADIAKFSLAMYVLQLAATPLGMISPILFNRWSRTEAEASIKMDAAFMVKACVLLVVLILLALVLIPTAVTYLFGPVYAGAVTGIRILILGIPFVYATNIGLPLLMATGRFASSASISTLKIVLCIGLMLSFFHSSIFDLVTAACLSILITEISIAFLLTYSLKRYAIINP